MSLPILNLNFPYNKPSDDKCFQWSFDILGILILSLLKFGIYGQKRVAKHRSGEEDGKEIMSPDPTLLFKNQVSVLVFCAENLMQSGLTCLHGVGQSLAVACWLAQGAVEQIEVST